MACGCPVVSTASSDAVRDLLETMGARAPVPVGHPAALAAALDQALDGRLPAVSGHAMLAYGIQTACDAHATIDRKSDVSGKRVSVRVDSGGCHIIKKTKNDNKAKRYKS